jgi:hypothetical protein
MDVEVNFSKITWRIAIYLLAIIILLSTLSCQVWLFRYDFSDFNLTNIFEIVALLVLLHPHLKLNVRLHENIHKLVMEYFGATDVVIDYKSTFPYATSKHPFTPEQYFMIALAPLVSIILPLLILVFYFTPAGLLYISYIIATGTGDIISSFYAMKYFGKNVVFQDKGHGFIIKMT